jgi:hypothetical protein
MMRDLGGLLLIPPGMRQLFAEEGDDAAPQFHAEIGKATVGADNPTDVLVQLHDVIAMQVLQIDCLKLASHNELCHASIIHACRLRRKRKPHTKSRAVWNGLSGRLAKSGQYFINKANEVLPSQRDDLRRACRPLHSMHGGKSPPPAGGIQSLNTHS